MNGRVLVLKSFWGAFCCVLALLVHRPAGAQEAAQETSPEFQRLDANKDGKVTKAEFPGPLFDRIDTNKDAVITADEDREFARRRQALGAGAVQGAARVPDSIQAEFDIPYAGTENPRQKLDLYLPKKRKDDAKPLPVVVFIHGGAWRAGDKRGGGGVVASLVESGEYAGCSIGYRLTGEAAWPAQIHDCKAAIRWLKGNAEKYKLDPEKIGVTGTSAGGHLVAMLGTAGDVPELEGELGEHRTRNSRVACVVNQFGPADFLAMGEGQNSPDSPVAKLIGGPVKENQEAARKASPTTYATKNDPPFLMIHGTQDKVVPYRQSELLHEVLQKAGVDSTLVAVKDGGHGGFRTPEVPSRLRQFFDVHLRGKEGKISAEAIEMGK